MPATTEPPPLSEESLRPAAARVRGVNHATGLKNMQLLIQLRWIAVVGQIVTILVANLGFGIGLPVDRLLTVLACLAAFNVASQLHWRSHREVTNGELFFALLVDVSMLTSQLYLSGGASNPFSFLYLLQVTLAALLLEAWSTWTMLAIAAACFASLAMFGVPLSLPPTQKQGLASPYVQGLLICFALNAVLLVIFITRIIANLRRRDARLADLRQRAAEEDHIVRMGLLATGAAHELGTPLATLAVILGDWARLPSFTSDPELLEEVIEMQAQIKRCKAIVSGILLSAGEARGESSEQTTVCTFLDGLIEEWRATRPTHAFVYTNRFGQDVNVVSDSALKQTICNILDNAQEASSRLKLDVARQADDLVLTVTDHGPGFTQTMLANFGKPYQSSKGRPGRGVGLFLAVNVARTLGGSLNARNRVGGGAVVTLRLPLSAITLDEEDTADARR